MTDLIGVSLADLLPKQLDGIAQVLKKGSSGGPGLPNWPVVRQAFERGLRDELGRTSLIDLLGEGWACAEALHAHRGDDEQTRAAVPFGQNKVSIQASPVVSVTLAGRELVPIQLSYSIDAIFSTLRLGVAGGRVVSAEPGECTISASLGCAGAQLHAPWTLQRFAVPGLLAFKPGIKIP